ncbi:7-carboxy-7-deazaguanine synthase QueE [Sulfuriroseicoccus oceanibius]|uniref:7-carboxy-7-deazaguanine synthase n=1 Tax=Sulfuriroseicoccus oceanibius TaxID=2707525 RepID=A0A7T7JDF3_9BACT|nr:7-carboxy-7-deazaguanine synthase QueE [Sulfuriroseicoccus oceanibius]QQL46270.1 7-carboxy-7-deazaguanine synthase QueE [Sulfuriroseicoccus oceanibius]
MSDSQTTANTSADDPASVMLKVARYEGGPEVFHTLQGEGASVGAPAVFVRLSLCNLHCIWCDTDYTWNWEGTPFVHENDAKAGYQKFRKDDQLIEVDAGSLAREIASYETRRVVITGGEPLLQQEGVVALMDALRAISPEYVFEVETNGTRVPSAEVLERVNQFNVSPKLANSGNKESQRIRSEAFDAFVASGKAWFKFVIAAPEDLDEVRGLVERFGLPVARVMLMPEGRSAEAIDAHRELVIEACLREGFRFADRLHLRLFGAKRAT